MMPGGGGLWGRGICFHISLIVIQPSSLQYMMKLMIWLKKLSRGHVVDIYIAWVENENLKYFSFRLLNS